MRTGRHLPEQIVVSVFDAEGRDVGRVVVAFPVALLNIRIAHVLVEGGVKSSTDWPRHLSSALDCIWRVVAMCEFRSVSVMTAHKQRIYTVSQKN